LTAVGLVRIGAYLAGMPQHPELKNEDVGFAYWMLPSGSTMQGLESGGVKVWYPIDCEYLWECYKFNEATQLRLPPYT